MLSRDLPLAPPDQHPSTLPAIALLEQHSQTVNDWFTLVSSRLKTLLYEARHHTRKITGEDFGMFREMEKNLRGIPALSHQHRHFRLLLLELLGRRADYLIESHARGCAVFPMDSVDRGVMQYRIALTRRILRESQVKSLAHDKSLALSPQESALIRAGVAATESKSRYEDAQDAAAAAKAAEQAERDAAAAELKAARGANRARRDAAEAKRRAVHQANLERIAANKSLARESVAADRTLPGPGCPVPPELIAAV